ncbi:MAG: nicotinate (nicotinamide) nucleotide adenylyltransferase [Phycisphaerae bacterium]|nr:nicotinate (nicotinamide) nucleotide adenylyltransferase [Phycisphaerae bacterium]
MTVSTPDRAPALVFGGTFDPPHKRHVDIARLAADALGARAILVIPAALNPQRTDRPPAAPEHRLAMTRIAFRNETRAQVLDLEIIRGAPSYSIDTLRELHARGEAPLRLLVGSDQALNLTTWKSWREVVALAPPAIVLRPPNDLASLRSAAGERFGDDIETWIDRVLPIPPIAVSSSALRQAIGGESLPASIEDLDPEVIQYIHSQLLYRQR